MKIEDKLKKTAYDLGFQLFGIADSHIDDEQVKFFSRWLEEGNGAGMTGWLERGLPKRADLNLILPGVQSVIVVGKNYYLDPSDEYQVPRGKVARYAWQDDYHDTIGDGLAKLTQSIDDEDAKWYVDTGAIFERYFAQKAGLGFIGKNTCLITPEFGSWVLLGVVLTKKKLTPTTPKSMGSCGDCRKCIEACPTGALSEKSIDCRKCIAYLTIEKKGEFSEEECAAVSRQDFCFGCDVCQEVCPHNARQKAVDRRPKNGVFASQKRSILALEDIPESDEGFKEKFKNSPILRAKRQGIIRNLNCLNSRH